jgi:hypothetical protein
MTAGHFIFIPSVMLIGVIIGWVLGSRAARDAFAQELKRREERAGRALHDTYRPTARRCASTSGNPAFTTLFCASSTA